jgi:hypothetical protein
MSCSVWLRGRARDVGEGGVRRMTMVGGRGRPEVGDDLDSGPHLSARGRGRGERERERKVGRRRKVGPGEIDGPAG